jgi:hypothetical protein
MSGLCSAQIFAKNHKQAAILFLDNKHDNVGEYIIVSKHKINNRNKDHQIFFSSQALIQERDGNMRLVE